MCIRVPEQGDYTPVPVKAHVDIIRVRNHTPAQHASRMDACETEDTGVHIEEQS